MCILRIVSWPGALLSKDLNVRNVSMGLIGLRSGLSGFSLLMSMTGYGVVVLGLRVWNLRFFLRDLGSILFIGGGMKWTFHSSRMEVSMTGGSVNMVPCGVFVSVTCMRLLLFDLLIIGDIPDQNWRGPNLRSWSSCDC